MEVRDVEVWELVDRRLEEVRRLPYDELCRRAGEAAQVELVERPSGRFQRRTRVVALPHERIGIQVAVAAEGRRPRADGTVIITSDGLPAPEWSLGGEAPRGNPFAFGPRVTLAGVALAVVLMLLFVLLA